MNKHSGQTVNRNTFVMGLTLVATLGGLLFGYDTAVISGAVGSLQAFFIDALNIESGEAKAVVMQYRVTVYVAIYVLIISVGTVLLKLLGNTRGIIFTAIALAVSTYVIAWNFSGEPILDSNTANSLKGFTTSSALIGCIIGGSMGGLISRKLGRKRGLILAALLFTVSAIGSAIPEYLNFFGVQSITSFIIYRIVGGIGVGLASMLSPMYIAEIAPPKIRGQLVSWNQFAIIFGMLVIYFVNYFISRQGDQEWLNETGWRWMFASETIPAGIFLILLFFVPETPRYLVMKGNHEKAMGILSKLNGAERSKEIFSEIRESLKITDAPWLSYGLKLIFIGIFLSVFQQFVGINVVLYYAPEIFRNMGSSTESSLLQTIIVGAVNLSFTVLAIMTVDRFGRKPLQIIGALGMAISMVALGFSFYFDRLGIGALFFMLLYTASFAMSWGPVTWVLLAEIFPNRIRGAMSIAVAAQWIANFMVSWTFPMMNDNKWLSEQFNHGFAYWIYGAMGIIAAIFVWKIVPETKGKTLEEMEDLWSA